tara:strand:+ start:3980 stop:5002 length:1023 start_codon:yes stop_codon:yes gene_type:complete
MKIANNKADNFINKPDSFIRATLIYGPNEGLVFERKKFLTQSFTNNSRDPFQLKQLDGDDYGQSWENLHDEVLSLSFTKGNRVLVINKLPEKLIANFETILNIIPSDLMLIIIQGDLKPTSKIRKFFENNKTSAALACYADEVNDLKKILYSTFNNLSEPLNHLQFESLSSRLSANRGINRQAIEKLYNYCNGDPKTLSHSEIYSVIQNEDNLTLETLAYTIANGELSKIPNMLESVFRQGTLGIIILRAASYHFSRLFHVIEFMKQGESFKSSISKLRPRIFFKLESMFEMQTSLWTTYKIRKAQSILINTEIECKLHYHLQRTLCERALYKIASNAKA